MTPRGVLALALVLAAPAAGAVSLGEIEVRSYLGDKLDARIAVAPGAGESIRGACFSLSPDGTPGVARFSAGELALQRSASGTYLRIRSTAPIDDPAFALGIVIACPGQAPQGTKEFSVLVDPRTRAAAPTVEAARPAASVKLGAREGDTLASIANAIFPRDRAARSAYLKALRETNPDLAARGDREPIASNEAVALPDLRTFMQGRRTQAASSLAATGALPPASSEPAAAAPSARKTPARTPRESTARRAAPAQPASELPKAEQTAASREAARAIRPALAPPAASPPRARPTSGGFQLKLSGSEVDLSRSNAIDDRSRAALRERLLMLDADDQVAAMLSMRNSLKQLEARVAELQLKLAGMPASLAGKGESTAAAKATPKAEPPAPVVAPPPKAAPPAPVIASAPKLEASAPPPAVTAKAETTPSAPVAAKTETPQPATDSTPAAATAKAQPQEPRPPRAVAYPVPAKASTLPSWLWAVVALLVVLVLLVAWYMLRRRRAREPEFYEEDFAPAQDPLDEIAPESMPIYAEEPEPLLEAAREERGVVASDADLATRIPEENADELRRRYIEERFPEIVSRMIVLEDADSVVKGARLFYEDRALPRAVELLHFAIEAHPQEVKTWLALFEIFRLERLTGEFAALAQRFKQQFGESDNWRKVQYFGREIDPGNALYQEVPLNTLETIGPREARRLAAAASFDPVAENWLNAPMDFENEVLANELRMVLMQHAGLTEQDLVHNPMPALRNVEMFTVA
jgi:hypothetical protein